MSRERRGSDGRSNPGGPAQTQQMAPGKRTLTESLPIQRKAEPSPASQTPSGAGAGGALPGALRERMERAFGFDFGGVRVHEGGKAPAVGALAYTQGADLHFAPGAYDPSSSRGQELIGHELAHVVQQSEGRVTATGQAKGVQVNEEDHLEREADAWGARAARGESVDRSGAATSPGASGPVQMAKQTSHFGDFVDTSYTELPAGVDIEITFKPGAEVDAKKIGLTQAVKQVAKGTPGVIADPAEATHMVPSGKVGAGHMIDRITTNTNPIYGSDAVASGDLKDTKETNNATKDPTSRDNATYQLGHHYTEARALKTQDAWMHDAPSGDGAANSSMIFETTALALDGAQKGTYYGSVTWGWQTDAVGKLKKVDFALISAGMPSANFLAAATQWNSATARGTVVTAAADTQVYDGSLNAVVKLAKETKVKVDGSAAAGGVSYNSITVDGGPSDGVTGYIKTADLTDKGDGTATTKLPVADVQVLSDAQELNKDVPGPWRETRTLAKGTRVVKTGNRPGLPSATQVWVKVVDGADLGAEGYVDSAKLTAERP